MVDYLNVDGRLIAHTQLEARLSDGAPPVDIFLFLTESRWSVLTIRRTERYDRDTEALISAAASVTVTHHDTVDELAETIEDRYCSYGWRQVLDTADYSCDPDLYLAWATDRIHRDFDAASIHVKDLALATRFYAGELVPAPGRAIDGWESHHLNLMAAHLTELGYEILDQDPPVLDQEPNPFHDPVLGALRVRRYGHDATGGVRVDDVGEVFIRLDYPTEDSPTLTPAPRTDDW